MQPTAFRVRVVCDQISHGQIRDMQDRVAHAQTAVQADTFNPHRPRRRQFFDQNLGVIDELTASDQFRQYHSYGLEGLYLFFRIMALGPVLNRDDPGHPTRTEHWHPHHRVVDFLTSFRPIDEIGMLLRIGQCEGPCFLRDISNDTLAKLQTSFMNGTGFQALGCKQLQHIAAPPNIDRANLRDHVRGNNLDDVIQPLLRGRGTGHHVADTCQKSSRRRQHGDRSNGRADGHHYGSFPRFSNSPCPGRGM